MEGSFADVWRRSSISFGPWLFGTFLLVEEY